MHDCEIQQRRNKLVLQLVRNVENTIRHEWPSTSDTAERLKKVPHFIAKDKRP